MRRRSVTISEELLEDEEREYIGGEHSNSEEDHYLEESESAESSEDELSEAENASLNTRLLESNARGRLRSVLKVVDGFKWYTSKGTRTSGNFIYIHFFYFILYLYVKIILIFLFSSTFKYTASCDNSRSN